MARRQRGRALINAGFDLGEHLAAIGQHGVELVELGDVARFLFVIGQAARQADFAPGGRHGCGAGRRMPYLRHVTACVALP
ncbi:MAG: hypothetical protein U5L03_09285 [Burkholderiaceae bacterium]|nr:hypothetical protein [Burkholderiaceae bacterium]